MKWNTLIILIASLMFVMGSLAQDDADEIEIPDDISDDDLDDDEEILRLIEEKRIVNETESVKNIRTNLLKYFLFSVGRFET